MRLFGLAAVVLAVTGSASTAQAQVTAASMQALATFGTNGWLAPAASSGYLTTSGDTQRGMAYHSATNEVLVAFRQSVSSVSNSIVRFDGTTGAVIGVMNNSGITGGTFLINAMDVAADGAIYAGNLANGTSAIFKVYRWQDAAATPTVAYTSSALPLSGITRIGDSFAVFGSGAATQFAAAGQTTTAVNNFIVGSGFSAGSFGTTNAYVNVTPTTSATSNDYRLTLTFQDADTLIGSQGGVARITDFGPTSATITASTSSLGGTSNNRIMDYVNVAGTPLLAVLNSPQSAGATSTGVGIYDITNPASPVLLANGNAATGTGNTNGNATGAVSWGPVTDNLDNTYTARLYTLNTNNGVQAFNVTFTAVPEPTTWALLGTVGISAGVAALRRRWTPRA